MGLFKSFEEKAKRSLENYQNPSPKIDTRKFKDLNSEEEVEPFEEYNEYSNKETKKKEIEEGDYDEFDDYGNFDNQDSINLYPAQRPESFHFFILENQYRDLERAIRGVKDVWDKETQSWKIKRKAKHCFTDEESEDIVRTAQSHLSSDIKLAIFNRDEYPILLNGVYEQLWVLFKGIMDYRFGRFRSVTEQLEMKQQAVNIFNMLMMRIKANYSRAIEGRENRATHDSVKGQESLQQTERRELDRSYS